MFCLNWVYFKLSIIVLSLSYIFIVVLSSIWSLFELTELSISIFAKLIYLQITSSACSAYVHNIVPSSVIESYVLVCV